VGLRNRKYGRVDPLQGPVLLEKLTTEVDVKSGSAAERFAGALGSRFGMR